MTIYVLQTAVINKAGKRLTRENPKLEFLQAVNVNCPQMRLDCLFISRKGRKGELRTITENYPIQSANPQTLAITGVSADCLYCAKRMRPGA